MSNLAETALAPTSRTRAVLVIVVLLSGAPAMALMFTALGPVLPSLMHEFSGRGDGALIAQLVMTTPSLGIILAGAPIGWLVERFGATTVLRWSLFCYGLSGSAGLLLESLPAFIATRLALGLAASGIGTSALALVGEHFTADQRARVLSYQTAAGALTGFVSLLCAGAAAESFGWRAPFALYLLAWPLLVCSVAVVPVSRGVAASHVDRPVEAYPNAERASLRPLWPLFGLIIIVFIVVFMNAVQLSFLLAADGITSPAVQSWVLASGSVGNAVGALCYGWLRPRVGARGMFACSLACLGIGNLLLGASDGVVLKVIGAAISAAGGGAVGPHLVGMLLDRAEPSVRGRAAGLSYSATFFGDLVNPVALAPLRWAVGIHGTFVAIGVACVAGALFVFGRRGRDTGR